MSGGRLVVLDRLGRDVKQYSLPSGLATLGRDYNCDIRVMLSTVSPHHATVVVHANQTVVRNVSDGETLVNGRAVSVAALRHNDVITIGERSLRWEYDQRDVRRPLAPEPALHMRSRSARPPRPPRRASGAPPAPRPPGLALALELQHRASMPGNAGGKQVAIVQPQRRDTNESNATSSAASSPRSAQSKRPRISKYDTPDPAPYDSESDRPARKSSLRISPKSLALQNTTKATLWIESRKTSPRKSIKTPTHVVAVRKAASAKKSTPLRLTVLRKAQSARKVRVTKIEAPVTIDHTKRAAIMLMTGHTPKTKLTPARASRGSGGGRGSSSSTSSTSLLLKRPSPVPRPSRGRRSTKRGSAGNSVSVLEITDSDTQNSTAGARSSRLSRLGSLGSPLLPSPKKSALKNPSIKKTTRKTESIKFDLSNLKNHTQDQSVLMVTDITSDQTYADSASEGELTLHYDSSFSKSPSPRRSIHSRSSRILEKFGTSVESRVSERSTLTPESPRSRRSLRCSVILQKALDNSASANTTAYSRRNTKTLTDQSYDTTVASAFKTRTMSPRSSNKNLESYSIVDLVSVDSNESGKSASMYGSVGSTRSSSIIFGTPQNSSGRKTRSTIEPNLLGSSTPYVGTKRSNSSPNISKRSPNISTRSSASTRRSKSLTTPENAQTSATLTSIRIPRTSRSRSRINDSDLQYISSRLEDEADESPKSSRKSTRSAKSPSSSIANKSVHNKRSSSLRNLTLNTTAASVSTGANSSQEGSVTPENRISPQEASTPVLSIQSLLNSSQSSLASQSSRKKISSIKRKTIGAIHPERKGRSSLKSKSFNVLTRKSRRSGRVSKESADSNKTDANAPQPDNEDTVTPKSAVKLVQEAVKNKHSTAKKPQSKRSIIDNLNESDIVKQLFNSPVKRKLSQSMTEFSRKQLFDDDEVAPRRPTRNTIALTGRTPNDSLFNNTDRFSAEDFVSPLGTPNSTNLSGVKRLFKKNTPENDLRNVRGVRSLMRTPRTRRSVRNDLRNVSGVKSVFAKSPKNRLSDVRVKGLFAGEPKNDLKRVSGVKALFQAQNVAKNDLSDVRGVKKLFTRKSAANDLRNVSGVKRTLQARSPKNDLTDVRGVKRIFRQSKQHNDYDVSGIEELFNESNNSNNQSEILFDKAFGKPPVKAVYSKSFVTKRPQNQNKSRLTKSLHTPVNTHNVEEWLQQEMNKIARRSKSVANTSASKAGKSWSSPNDTNVRRELLKLTTDTVEGSAPILTSRIRNSTLNKSQLETSRKKSASELYSAHTLPIKKRSLIEASMEKSRNDTKLTILPIKKRAVVHSTPVKGRYNLTMNASELGRVSPIAVVDKTRNLENDATIKSVQQKGSPKTKGRATKVIVVQVELKSTPQKSSPARGRRGGKLTITVENPKIDKQTPKSPKQTRKETRSKTTNITDTKSPQANGRRSAKAKSNEDQEPNIEPPKTRRTRNNTEKQETVVKVSPKQMGKRATKSKSVIEKPASPKPSPKKTRATKAKPKSPARNKNTRSRNKTDISEVTNTRKRRSSLVITKKPPVLSPKPTKPTRKAEKVSSAEESPKKPISTRRQKAEIVDEKVKTPKNTRAKVSKSSVVVVKPSPKMKPVAAKTRGRNNVTSKSTKESPKKSPTVSAKRSRKTEKVEDKSMEPQTKRGRSKVAQTAEKPKPPKKAELQQSVQSEATTRSRRTKVDSTVIPEQKGRKRKNADEQIVVPPKVTKTTRGRKTASETVVETKSKKATARGGKVEAAKVTESVVEPKTRAKRSAKVEDTKTEKPATKGKSTRGKKSPAAVASSPQLGRKTAAKRKTAASASPVKVSKRARVAAGGSPATRTTRSKPAQPVAGAAGPRGRRR